MYLYVERDFVIGISYTGIQWLYLIIKVRSYTLEMCLEMVYFLNYTIQQDKNPLNTSNNAAVHTVRRDENNTLFLTAERSTKHKK